MVAQYADFPSEQIADVCRRYRVHELALFGSYQQGTARPDSDVDLLVEFEPGTEIGFISLARMGRELSVILKRQVDLVPKKGLKEAIRLEVLSNTAILYAA
ncbi:MAG: nucleotidyltransferase family protein [Deltaproteobacteria bacterium]|nr:nucleotidyltransferase family protein [Deltaproteobacteria bacterium]